MLVIRSHESKLCIRNFLVLHPEPKASESKLLSLQFSSALRELARRPDSHQPSTACFVVWCWDAFILNTRVSALSTREVATSSCLGTLGDKHTSSSSLETWAIAQNTQAALGSGCHRNLRSLLLPALQSVVTKLSRASSILSLGAELFCAFRLPACSHSALAIGNRINRSQMLEPKTENIDSLKTRLVSAVFRVDWERSEDASNHLKDVDS